MLKADVEPAVNSANLMTGRWRTSKTLGSIVENVIYACSTMKSSNLTVLFLCNPLAPVIHQYTITRISFHTNLMNNCLPGKPASARGLGEYGH